jgi:2-haloacid dehalogenase
VGRKFDRRGFLAATGASVMGMSLSGPSAALAPQAGPGADRMNAALSTVKACVFDTFGTVVDWRSSVNADTTKWGKAKGLNINWVEFTDRWRMGYKPAMDKVRKGELPWTSLDDLHRMILEDLLKDYRIDGLSEEEKIDWAHVWRRLKPWPDSVEGLTRLKDKYIISPMSNGNVALMVHLAKFARLPWDVVLGSDLVRHYKPDREIYLSAVFYLDLKPEEVMMCAAHVGDLQAARSCGLRTGFIYRPNEYGGGPVGVPDKAKPGDFDVFSVSLIDLAQQLGS